MDYLLQLKNIEVYLGDRFNLKIPHLDLAPCKIHIFHGPNGAGKSTLLHLLSFLLRPNLGEIWFQGERVTFSSHQLIELRRKVTLVEQSPYLFSGSVHHNLSFGLRIRGIHGVEKYRRIAEALTAVGMREFLRCNVRELSGGEVQRIALARALVLRSKVLLLDEPASNIDRESLNRIESILVKLPTKGVTVIMSSHDENQAQRLGGDVVHISGGRLIEDST